jgi:radical SAM protein with 4Fe4S-binding SPASM domain
MYSFYVQPTVVEGRKVLYHTLLNKTLPADADEETLRANKFLSGQEQDSLWDRIFLREDKLKFFYISTWGCTLRCPFCFVLKQLKKVDNSALNPDEMYTFLDNYHKKYPQNRKIEVCYLGGEPLLNIDNCLKMCDVTKRFCQERGITLSQSVTTNATIDLTDDHMRFLEALDLIVVSIDGDEEHHNAQRKVYMLDVVGQEKPFMKSLKVLKKMCDSGLSHKISINSALGESMFNSPQRMKEFVLILTAIGVNPKSINLCTLIPTACQSNVTKQYKEYLNSGFVFPKPCCVFQYMSFFAVHDNKLYGNYYELEQSLLGTLIDPIEDVAKSYRQYVKDRMPILKDETCMKCPVVGYCWGGCNHSLLLKDSPSKCCNQPALIDKVKKSAEDGTITTFGEDHRSMKELCVSI